MSSAVVLENNDNLTAIKVFFFVFFVSFCRIHWPIEAAPWATMFENVSFCLCISSHAETLIIDQTYL